MTTITAGEPTLDFTATFAMFYGGLIQLLAGMWEMWKNNTFAATAFSSYGANVLAVLGPCDAAPCMRTHAHAETWCTAGAQVASGWAGPCSTSCARCGPAPASNCRARPHHAVLACTSLLWKRSTVIQACVDAQANVWTGQSSSTPLAKPYNTTTTDEMMLSLCVRHASNLNTCCSRAQWFSMHGKGSDIGGGDANMCSVPGGAS